MPRLIHRTPKYAKHRASGQAVVKIDGRCVYLGPHGTKASRDEYDRVIGEWMTGGRRLVVDAPAVTVAEVIVAFWRHAQRYYVTPDGRPSSEQENMRQALRPLRRLYGRTPAADFGPLALKALREQLARPQPIDKPRPGGPTHRPGWARTHINRQVARLKGVFKWAAAHELVPPSVYHGLQAVPGLRAGKAPDVRESDPVKPVPDADVAAVRQMLSPPVRAMVDLQLATGMRPGELCAMQTRDVDTTGAVWIYRPAAHKTAHHGHTREVYIGPKAQQVLRPYLRTDLASPVFSPREAAQAVRDARHAARVTPPNCGNRPGTNRRRQPRRQPGDGYTVTSYRRAIARACERAGVPRWHPHQLRHNAATRWRAAYGPDVALTLLGDTTTRMIDVYAEKDRVSAMRVVGEAG